MYGLEPTAGVAYNAYVPILQSAFAVSGSNPATTTTTTTRGSTTTTKATTTTTKATTVTTTSRVTSTGTTSLPSPTGACAARYGQCGVSRYPQHIEENNLDLTKYRVTAGQARHAVRAARRAPRRTSGTPNACRCETWQVNSSYGVTNLTTSKHRPHWHVACLRVKLRTGLSLCSCLVGDSFSQILRCVKSLPISCSPEVHSLSAVPSSRLACPKTVTLLTVKQSSFWRQGGSCSSTWKAVFDIPIAAVPSVCLRACFTMFEGRTSALVSHP
jgi:hypothetical protein